MSDNPFGRESSNLPSTSAEELPAYLREDNRSCVQRFKDWSPRSLMRTMRILNFLNAIGLLVIYPLGMLGSFVALKIDTLLLSAYGIFFGALLCCFESHIGNTDEAIRKRFGFLFSYRGRALFLLFLGTVCIAGNWWGGTLMGIVTCLNAFFQGFAMLVHPAFRDGVIDSKGDPSKGYTAGEAEMLAYAKAHPDMTKKALTTGAKFAKNNPNLVKGAVRSAASNPTVRSAAIDVAKENPKVAISIAKGAYGAK